MLKKVISGGQTGVDQAALWAAKQCKLETGGFMPKGFKTLSGYMPEFKKIYGMKEIGTPSYSERTELNVVGSDATIRIAYDFISAGEMCTLNYICLHQKPHFDVSLPSFPKSTKHDRQLFFSDHSPIAVAKWIVHNKIVTLNIAGNSEQTCKGINEWASFYLLDVFQRVKKWEKEKRPRRSSSRS